jgi:hypothetical protein
MKTLRPSTAALLTLTLMLQLLLSWGCTTNNGDIGPLYGQWKLTDISVDGVSDANYAGDIFWLFQSHVISMRRTDADHTQHACYGSWTRPTDDLLELDFTHTDDGSPDIDYRYTPFTDTLLPRAIARLTIVTLNSSRFVAAYDTTDGRHIVYTLEKW